MQTKDLTNLAGQFPPTPKMPVLFLGHGSPMNAIEENEFVQTFREIAKQIPKPHAIVCVSAHWETQGTRVTAMPQPHTIHDFGGFPQALFQVQYPAPGSPELADHLQRTQTKSPILADHHWGFDHGAWSVIKHLYPEADIPMIQLSLDINKKPEEHYELAKDLQKLRHHGILIVGSGNLVHNLGLVDWRRINDIGHAFDWAAEAKEKINRFILSSDHQALKEIHKHGQAMNLAIPTPEHYLPLLYVLAMQDKEDEISLFNDKALAGSLTMTSVKLA